MQLALDHAFKIITGILTVVSLLLLSFIMFFILKESSVFFKEVGIFKFILGRKWNPLGTQHELTIFPIILGTLYVSILGILIALPIGLGHALVLSCYIHYRWKEGLRSVLNVLAGIPSVIYGFIGLLVVVRFFERRLLLSTGESVLAGGVVLAAMMLPFIISTCEESMEKIYNDHLIPSNSLGVSKSYMVRNIVLPNAKRSIFASIVLALGRGMGETMAVMMVIGNAPLMPKLFGKCQTIPSLIALEMGMAGVGSLHYHGLYASGTILMLILLVINMSLHFLKKRLI